MPIAFTLVCDLLEQSYALCRARKSNVPAVQAWFARHRTRISAHDTDLAALLSTLLPEKRTDRVYCIQAASLEKIVGRALMLGSSRMHELATYKRAGVGMDLADCVERILSVTPNPPQPERLQVTVEEVDELLHRLASGIKWSSPAVRKSKSSSPLTQRGRSDLEAFYRRFSPRDAKWFTRLVLKDYQPLIFDQHLIYKSCDPVLPYILKIRDDFSSAIGCIQLAKGNMLPTSRRAPFSGHKMLAAVKPELGTKVGRQQWLKGRSIKHCMDMARGRVSVEAKLDGEYCQIHVDLSKTRNMIQIFSKSGKDSTEDRSGLIGAIKKSLRVGTPDCKITQGCILEGELVVYSDFEHKIQPFHKIRKYVARRGRFMNTDQDSQPKPYEHLMIVYYDMLLLDDTTLLNVRHSERARLLQETVYCERGMAELVPREIVDFDHSMAASALRKAFAKVIVERGEGLVLRPDEPYIVVNDRGHVRSGRCIKLKKEYIGTFGDVGDFALVGAGFDATRAKTLTNTNVKWTHFYVGCLNNKEEVKRWSAMPEFTVISVVEMSEALLQTFINNCDTTSVPLAENKATQIVLAPGIQSRVTLEVAFTNPSVADLRCFSFDKPGNTGFWTPRFPAVTKLHFDRDYSDVVTFDELQAMAKDAVNGPEFDDSQENRQWIANLENADPRGVAVDAVSQLTATTMPTPSPQKSTQDSRATKNSQGSAKSGSHNGDAAVEEARKIIRNPLPLLPPLITPPTSSPFDEQTPKATGANGSAEVRTPQKRSLQNLSSSPTYKRRRVSNELGTVPEERTPLGEVPVNRSLCIPETQSSEELSFRSCESQRNTSNNMPQTKPKDKENEDFSVTNAEEFDSPFEQQPSTQPVSTNECVYKAGKCSLAGTCIFLPSSSLQTNCPELLTLLTRHGINTITPNIEEWWEGEEEARVAGYESATTTTNPDGNKRMLLVDSVQQPKETKALMSRLDTRRKDFRRDKRDWITVYDWRVLKHVTVFEDESVVKKYYDGFQDPWRRWYCGLV